MPSFVNLLRVSCATLAGVLGMALMTPAARGASAARNWTGEGADSNWSTAANWNGNTVPAGGDDVTFGDLADELEGKENVNLDVDVLVGNLVFASGFDNDGTGAAFSIAAGKRLMVRGANFGGNFIVSDGALVTFGSPERLTITGTFTFPAGTFQPTGGTTLLIAGTNRIHDFGNAVFNDLVVADATGPSPGGLVGYWPMNEIPAAEAADASGTGITLTASATVDSAPEAAAPLLFASIAARNINDGGSLRATPFPAALQTATWTLSAWVWVGSVGALGGDVINGGDDYVLRIDPTTHDLTVVMKQDDTTWAVCDSGIPLGVDDTWHQIIGINDGQKLTAYVDGARTVCAGYSGSQQYNEEDAFSIGQHPASAGYQFVGVVDDVRVYGRALSDPEAMLLSAGAGGPGAAIHSASRVLRVGGALTVDSGTLDLSGDPLALAAGSSSRITTRATLATGPGLASFAGLLTVAGTYALGGGTASAGGGVSVAPDGTLRMVTAGGILQIADGRSLTINGTLQTALTDPKPVIQAASGTFAFNVGTQFGAAAVLDINGLVVQNTGADGMRINAESTANTIFTSFRNIDYQHSESAGGPYDSLLRIDADSLNLLADKLTFDTTNTASNVRLVDRGGAAQNDVRLFVGGTCTPAEQADCEAHDADGDDGVDGAANDNVADNESNGAIVFWGLRGHSDTAGTVVGYPISSFEWDDYSFWREYVLFDNASGTTDRLYARDTDGAPLYSWDLIEGEGFIGPPRWNEKDGVHYVYLLTTAGHVYKLKDTGFAFEFETQAPPWNTAYDNGGIASATSPLAVQDGEILGLYWAGNNSAGQPRLFKLTSEKTFIGEFDLGPYTVTSVPVVANVVVAGVSSTAIFVVSNINGANGVVCRIASDFSGSTVSTQPLANVSGKVTVVGGTAYFVDESGRLWAIDANSETLATRWSYQDAIAENHGGISCVQGNVSCTAKNLLVDWSHDRAFFGDQDGHVYEVTGGSADPGWPFRPGSSDDQFVTAPLLRAGVLVIGASNGNLYFIDRSTGTMFRKYELGAPLSTISYDHNSAESGEYTIATATAPGRLYYISTLFALDPTPEDP